MRGALTVLVTGFDFHPQLFFFMYLVNWKVTWASGIYFKEVISKKLSAYTKDYYIFHWIDDNEQDGIPQNPEFITKQ